MNPATIELYGGPFADASVISFPTSEQSSAFANKALEDTAQLTRPTARAWATFTTTTASGPVAATVTDGQSHAGTASAQWPTVTKTATGLYTVAWPLNFLNGLNQTETRGFLAAMGTVWGATFGHVQPLTVSGGTATIKIYNSSFAASDLGGSVPITVWAY